MTESYAERKRNEKGETFNRIIQGITSKQKDNGTKRRFKSIGENHGFSSCSEHYPGDNERILVLLRGDAHVGSDNRSG